MDNCKECTHFKVCGRPLTIKALEGKGYDSPCEFYKFDVNYKDMVTRIVDVDDRTLFTTYHTLKDEISLLNSYAKAMSTELLRREP